MLSTPAQSTQTSLYVIDPLAGLCAIGREFNGYVTMDASSLLQCRDIQLGGQAGASGTGFVTVEGGIMRALESLRVGQAGGGAGRLEMVEALVATEGTYIAPNGVIAGTGKLVVGSLGLIIEGIMSPGINVQYPLASAAAHESTAQTQDGTETLAITGTLTIGPTGRLAIPVTGSSPGQYGSLAVTGGANLGGVLALDFRDGYAPRRGDTFTFLTATGGISGTFASVAINGLPPGFEYKLTTAGGQLKLEALNDGAPLRKVYLPLAAR
jgi:hypothetical protein